MSLVFNPFTKKFDYLGAGSVGGATSPGGTNNQIQYNNNGSFAGAVNLVYDATNNKQILKVNNAQATDIFQVWDNLNANLLTISATGKLQIITAGFEVGGQSQFHSDLLIDNNKTVQFAGGTGNNSSIKGATDGTMLFDSGANTNWKVKAGDAAGATKFGYTDASFNYIWNVDSLGRVVQTNNLGITLTGTNALNAIDIILNTSNAANKGQYIRSNGFAHTGVLSQLEFVNATDSGTALKIVNVGTTAKSVLINTNDLVILQNGQIGFGVTAPTARLHLGAGQAAAGFAPMKFTSGVLLSTVEAGAVEYDGTHAYITIGTTRYQIDQQNLPLDRGEALATGISTARRREVNGALTIASGELWVSYFTAAKNLTATVLQFNTGGTAGAGLTLARVGLYTVDASDNLTLVASNASDTTGWNATFSPVYKTFTSSYALKYGVRYAVGVIFVGTTPPSLVQALGSSDYGANLLPPRLLGKLTGQTDLPSSVTATALVGYSASPYGILT